MTGGSVAMSCTSSGKATESGEVGDDTVQPQTGWWTYEKKACVGRKGGRCGHGEALADRRACELGTVSVVLLLSDSVCEAFGSSCCGLQPRKLSTCLTVTSVYGA